MINDNFFILLCIWG